MCQPYALLTLPITLQPKIISVTSFIYCVSCRNRIMLESRPFALISVLSLFVPSSWTYPTTGFPYDSISPTSPDDHRADVSCRCAMKIVDRICRKVEPVTVAFYVSVPTSASKRISFAFENPPLTFNLLQAPAVRTAP